MMEEAGKRAQDICGWVGWFWGPQEDQSGLLCLTSVLVVEIPRVTHSQLRALCKGEQWYPPYLCHRVRGKEKWVSAMRSTHWLLCLVGRKVCLLGPRMGFMAAQTDFSPP